MASPRDPRANAGAGNSASHNGGASSSGSNSSQRPQNPAQNPASFGGQVWDAVQGAVESQQFADLSATVRNGLDLAAQGISQGLSQANQGMQRAQAQMQQAQTRYQQEQIRQQQEAQRRQELARIESRYRSPGGLATTGVVMAITGGILTFDAGVFLLVDIAMVADAEMPAVSLVIFALLLALCIWLLRSGLERVRQANRFKTYKRVLGPDEMVSIKRLAQQTDGNEARTLATVRKLLDRGMFVEGALDDTQTTLLVTRESYEAYRAARTQHQERVAREAELAQARASVPAQDVRVEKPEDASLSPEARALKKRGDAYLVQLREADVAIEDEAVSAKIVQIESVVSKIIDHAAKNPQVIDDLGQLMNYYLPMTVKLLDAYQDLDSQPVQGENIRSSKREIEATLDTLSRAFENLLDDVFKDMTWDVSTDISVLHAVLAQEGLIDDPFGAQSGAAAQAAGSRAVAAGQAGSARQAIPGSQPAGAGGAAGPTLTLEPDLLADPVPGAPQTPAGPTLTLDPDLSSRSDA